MDSQDTPTNTTINKYTCTKCKTTVEITFSSAIICANCYNRIFRKESTGAIIRIKAV